MKRGFAPIIVLIITAIVVIGVGGYLMFGPEKELALPAEETIKSAEEVVQPAADETASWNTYRNEEYGFEFEYPPEWDLGERTQSGVDYGGGTEVSICKGGGYGCDFSVSFATPNFGNVGEAGGASIFPSVPEEQRFNCSAYRLKPCNEFSLQGRRGIIVFIPMGNLRDGFGLKKAAIIENFNPDFPVIQVSQAAVGFSCTRFEWDDRYDPACVSTETYIPYVQKIVSTSLPESNQEEFETFDQVVSSLRFIDETADWKTYRNEEYGFEFEYPNDWYYDEGPRYDTQSIFCFSPNAFRGDCGGILITVSWDIDFNERYNGIKNLFSEWLVVESEIEIADTDAKLLTISGYEEGRKGSSGVVLFKRDGLVYYIAVVSGKDRVFDRIVEDWRFLEK